MRNEIDNWLRSFSLEASLHAHTAEVLQSLPAPVLADFMEDPAFSMCDYEPGMASGYCVPMKLIGTAGRLSAGRAVVLKRTLLRRPTEFVRWVIAHELAHAHLRNAGRWPGDDPEHAADALAGEWGFPRPLKMPWR